MTWKATVVLVVVHRAADSVADLAAVIVLRPEGHDQNTATKVE
jgi:hypothetical protein